MQVAEQVQDHARTALRWSVAVATQQPELLAEPPERPAPEALSAIPLDEMRTCLDALLMGRYTQQGLDALLHMGVLDVWLPEVKALVGFGDGEWRHKDVWRHTKQVVWQSVPRLAVRWGCLLHDIGKVKTRSVTPDGQVHFFAHSEVGAAMFRRRMAQRLGFTGELRERIHFLILHHLRASQYDGSWTDSAVRRFHREMGAGLTDLLDLSRADITTKRPEKRKRGLRQISELSARVQQLQQQDEKQPPLPKGIGNAIMVHFALPASRRIGELKQWLEGEVEEGRLEPYQSIEHYVGYLEAHRDQVSL